MSGASLQSSAVYRWPLILLAGLPPLILTIWLALDYLPFISDDALISLRYAQRFLEGQGLTWTAGPPVEGYSNLLWILFVSALGWAGCDLIVAARALGFAGSILTLLAVLHAQRPSKWSDCPAALAAGLGLALSGPFLVWTVGGLEQPLQAALLAWAVVGCYPLLAADRPVRRVDLLCPGVALALLCLTRPDGALFTVAACCGLLLALGKDRTKYRLALRLAILPVLAYLAQLVFRLAYYGEWVPNPALAKLGFTGQRLLEGLAYLGEGLLFG